MAETKKKEVTIGPGPLDWLKKINDFLETIPGGINNYFNVVFKKRTEVTQAQVDSICRYAAWKVNVSVEKVRQKVIKTLYAQYQHYLIIIAPIQALMSALSNPLAALGALASAVSSIINIFIKPFAVLIQYLLDLIKELKRLATNLSNINNALPPTPPSPHINFNEFKLDVGTISFGIITQDPSNLPDPEAMFPKPDPVFSKANFNKSFEAKRESWKKVKYVWKRNKGTTTASTDSTTT